MAVKTGRPENSTCNAQNTVQLQPHLHFILYVFFSGQANSCNTSCLFKNIKMWCLFQTCASLLEIKYKIKEKDFQGRSDKCTTKNTIFNDVQT